MNNSSFSISPIVYLIIGLTCIIAPFLLFLFAARFTPLGAVITELSIVPAASSSASAVKKEIQKKIAAPAYVRGIYLTAYSAGRDQWRRRLLGRMKNSRINSVVIDIKDYSGRILYPSRLGVPSRLNTVKPQIKDVRQVLAEFHKAGIYIIARQAVFQDPALAKVRPELALKTYGGYVWRDKSGLAWTDPQNREVWDYNIALAKEAAGLGFDEINFDYVRYPSDGNLRILNFNLPPDKSKAEILEEFFAYLSAELSGLADISLDMFGLVLDNAKRNYDLGIGQRLTGALPYFDFICPMVYPSHYPLSYLGLGNPAAHPRTVISHDIMTSEKFFIGQRAGLRPWLQAFNLGAVYDKRKMDAETDAVESATSTTGWLLWNARNYYPNYIFRP